MGIDDDRSRIEDLLYYLFLMAGRNFTGSFYVSMYDGRISRSSFQRLRKQLRVARVPFETQEQHVEVEA